MSPPSLPEVAVLDRVGLLTLHNHLALERGAKLIQDQGRRVSRAELARRISALQAMPQLFEVDIRPLGDAEPEDPRAEWRAVVRWVCTAERYETLANGRTVAVGYSYADVHKRVREEVPRHKPVHPALVSRVVQRIRSRARGYEGFELPYKRPREYRKNRTPTCKIQMARIRAANVAKRRG